MCKMCEETDLDWLQVAAASNKKAREAEEAAKLKATAAKREPEATPADARR